MKSRLAFSATFLLVFLSLAASASATAPVANLDTIPNGGPRNVLANDIDVDGDSLTLISYTQPQVGTASCASDGVCTTNIMDYASCTSPFPTGDTTFTYTVSDGQGGTAIGTVRQFVVFACPPPGVPTTLTLAPETATNTTGQQHCVTATVTDAYGTPIPGITDRFAVSGANSASGSGTTNSNGQAQFCYTGTNAGNDTISAYADTNNSTTQDSGEPGDTASKTYTAPPQGKISARGTVQTAQGPKIGFSAANNCNRSLSTQPSIVGTTAGGRIWTKSSVTASSCTDQPFPSPLGFDTQTGTASGTFGPSAPGGRNGQQGTLEWTYHDGNTQPLPCVGACDTVQYTLRDSSNNVVYQVATQTPTPYQGSPGGVWTSGP